MNQKSDFCFALALLCTNLYFYLMKHIFKHVLVCSNSTIDLKYYDKIVFKHRRILVDCACNHAETNTIKNVDLVK